MTMPVEGLRLLQVLAVRGSLSAAAAELGYTQSGASRQLAALERAAGRTLVERGPRGARLSAAGVAVLPHAAAVLAALEAAQAAAAGSAPAAALRLGVFISAGAALVPQALQGLAAGGHFSPVRTMQGTSPALARAVASGRLDAALVVSRPPFAPWVQAVQGGQRLREDVIGTMGLCVAVAAGHQLAARATLSRDDLQAAAWIGSARQNSDPTLGVWPGLRGRPDVRHRSGDWLAKLALVAAGLGITTVAPIITPALPGGVVLRAVSGLPVEQRRITLLSSGGAVQMAQMEEVVEAVEALAQELAGTFAELIDQSDLAVGIGLGGAQGT